MSALTKALAAVQNGTGCPRCLVGRRDLRADPMFNCEICHGTGVPHFQLLSAAEDLLAALRMVRDADEDCRQENDPNIMPDAARATIDAAIAKAEGR